MAQNVSLLHSFNMAASAERASDGRQKDRPDLHLLTSLMTRQQVEAEEQTAAVFRVGGARL